MIDNRRKPKPPRASSKINSPASSGPRCVITSRIAVTSVRSTVPCAAPYSQTPQMPHIIYFRLPIADCCPINFGLSLILLPLPLGERRGDGLPRQALHPPLTLPKGG